MSDYDTEPVRPVGSKSTAQLTYILFLLGYFGGLPVLIGIIMSYVNKGMVSGTWLESHYRWQIRTFWIWLIGIIISAPLCLIIVGYFFVVAISIWYYYRVIKGLMMLNNGRSIN